MFQLYNGPQQKKLKSMHIMTKMGGTKYLNYSSLASSKC